jgi:hypothetical protein
VNDHLSAARRTEPSRRAYARSVVPARIFLPVMIAALSLTGCGETRRDVREEAFPAVQIGMELSDLEQMFGPGKEMSGEETLEMFGELEADRFKAEPKDNASAPKGVNWKGNDYALSVLLVNNEVVAKGQSGKLKFNSKGSGLRQ